MKFGLFGGATVAGAGDGSDSPQQYRAFIDYVLEAEQLGFHSVFLVEHHFTGFNQKYAVKAQLLGFQHVIDEGVVLLRAVAAIARAGHGGTAEESEFH